MQRRRERPGALPCRAALRRARTYAVNADCTGFLVTSHLANPPHIAHGNFVIVEQGRELFFVDNEDGSAAIAVGKRM